MEQSRLIIRAILGDHEAAKRLTDAGVLVLHCEARPKIKASVGLSIPMYRVFCHKCGKTTKWFAREYEARLAWNTRAPILSESEMEMLDGKEDP